MPGNEPEKLKCEIISWENFYNLSPELTRLIRESGFRPDLIAAAGQTKVK